MDAKAHSHRLERCKDSLFVKVAVERNKPTYSVSKQNYESKKQSNLGISCLIRSKVVHRRLLIYDGTPYEVKVSRTV